MPGPVLDALVFLINIIFGLYIMVVILRLLLQKLGASYHNPITQAIIKATQPLVKPLQRIIPGYKGFDLSIVVLLLILELAKVAILLGIAQQTFPDIGGWILWAITEGVNDVLDMYFYLIIIGAVLSWIPSMHHHPLTYVIACVTEPVLGVIRRVLPALGGFDFSPLVAIIVIKLVQILAIGPLLNVAVRLALA